MKKEEKKMKKRRKRRERERGGGWGATHVEFGFGLGEPLGVRRVDHEDDAPGRNEVIGPNVALPPAEIVRAHFVPLHLHLLDIYTLFFLARGEGGMKKRKEKKRTH